MDVEELLNYRKNLLSDAKDSEGFIQEYQVSSEVLPLMLDAKLVDSEDFTDSFFESSSERIKVNGFAVNDTGERLQIIIVDENTISEKLLNEDVLVSQRVAYETQFKRVLKFLSSSIKGDLTHSLQDSDPSKALVRHLSSVEDLNQFDVIEIFLITLTATVSSKNTDPKPKRMYCDDQTISFSYGPKGKRENKDFLILRKVIDLNFLYSVVVSRGNREPLKVDFPKTFGYKIEVIQAACNEDFESYLCVLNAEVLADLYKRFSSRLLEKNVRSFLQFKGVNKGIRDTIRTEPHKFIAFNNGLTITSTAAKIVSSKKHLYIETLEDFQIVNGGQTTASIYFSKKEGLDVSNVKVMAKINIVKSSSEKELDELISKISKYSNTQSRVSNVDLRSRNPQLVALKNLTDSVVTPSGTKWFFERSKGEFNTKIRMAGSNGQRIKRDYPPVLRFSKEQLAKYYTAWGDQPYMVKKGGEKVFRIFIENISADDDLDKKAVEIDRTFYEQLIARIILFRKMEKLYGQGKHSMGQLRSAVVPYSLSILYLMSDADKNRTNFSLQKIWKDEGVEAVFEDYLEQLLLLVNTLIKKYSASDDYGEYSKKPELWRSIKVSSEISELLESDTTALVLSRYLVKE
jgi:hypothetical protein